MKEYQITLIDEVKKMKEYFWDCARQYNFRSKAFKTLSKMRDTCDDMIADIVTSDSLLEYVEENEDPNDLYVLWTALQKDFGCSCFANCKEEEINDIAATCEDTCCYEDEDCADCLKDKKFKALMFAQWANAHQYKALKKVEQIQHLIKDVYELIDGKETSGCPGKRGNGTCGDCCDTYSCVHYFHSALENVIDDLRQLDF